mmetsp:Transcript_13428/g.20286  ORF Transcript_13428/g.20286 Transcript_13428/m.20286 type:complete len:267 (+) Transcript_13428:118-918(+)
MIRYWKQKNAICRMYATSIESMKRPYMKAFKMIKHNNKKKKNRKMEMMKRFLKKQQPVFMKSNLESQHMVMYSKTQHTKKNTWEDCKEREFDEYINQMEENFKQINTQNQYNIIRDGNTSYTTNGVILIDAFVPYHINDNNNNTRMEKKNNLLLSTSSSNLKDTTNEEAYMNEQKQVGPPMNLMRNEKKKKPVNTYTRHSTLVTFFMSEEREIVREMRETAKNKITWMTALFIWTLIVCWAALGWLGPYIFQKVMIPYVSSTGSNS